MPRDLSNGGNCSVEIRSSVSVKFRTKIIHQYCHPHISQTTCLAFGFINSSSHDFNPFIYSINYDR